MMDDRDAIVRDYTTGLFYLSLIAALAALAIPLAGYVWSGNATAIDAALMRTFRNPIDLTGLGGIRVERFVRDVTALGSFGVAALFVGSVGGYLVMSARANQARTLLVITIGGWLLGNALKIAVARPRPEVVPMLDTVSDASMPSGHTLMATLLYFTLAGIFSLNTQNERLRRFAFNIALLLACAVGVSRVYLGVHWPTDVLVAFALGTAWTAAALRLLTK